MIGIIGAMDIEVEKIKGFLTDISTETISGVNFVRGKFDGKDIVVAKCGVGKVFAGLCAEAMILKYAPELIINVGVAGCLDETLKIGDIVIADNVCQHDMDTSPLGDPIGMLSDINIIKFPADKKACELFADCAKELCLPYSIGTIASGDQFVSSADKKKFITDNFGAKSCEMEGGAIGHVCYVNNVPFAVLRAMSDGADDGAKMDFPTFAKMAAENSTRVIKTFLSKF
ncbi:MAG: 5'-methylthioadenosine/adenosylhomocysteine nucleosidase [Clostridia bacterium]|nr:5'-methylthioadenosine/adenosylhomocysteine nucleosidase [Clostridia bacterium]